MIERDATQNKKILPDIGRIFCFNAFRQLSAKRETDNHPLCGWATKVIPLLLGVGVT